MGVALTDVLIELITDLGVLSQAVRGRQSSAADGDARMEWVAEWGEGALRGRGVRGCRSGIEVPAADTC